MALKGFVLFSGVGARKIVYFLSISLSLVYRHLENETCVKIHAQTRKNTEYIKFDRSFFRNVEGNRRLGFEWHPQISNIGWQSPLFSLRLENEILKISADFEYLCQPLSTRDGAKGGA